MSIDHLVKAEVAAESLGISKFYLYKQAKAGKLPSYGKGKLLRFSVEELRAALRRPATIFD